MAVASYMNSPRVKTPRPQAQPMGPGSTGKSGMGGQAIATSNTKGGMSNPYSGYGTGPQNMYGGPQMSTDMGMGTMAGPPPSNPADKQRHADDVMRRVTQPPVSTNPVGPNTGGGWGLPQWNPSQPQTGQIPPGTPAPRSGAQNFYNSANPWRADFEDPNAVNKINTLLPVAQFDQNNMQYQSDFNEALRRWNAEFGSTQNQNAYQQGLSTRQQQSAEEQARIAAAQWGQQFGHTQNMDLQGLDLSRQQMNQQYQQGMDQNQATRDVAGTYADSNRYQANQQLAGQRYMSDQDRIAAMYGADQGLRQAGMYSDAQRYQAQLGLQEAQGYAGAQRYQADQGLAGQQYQADRGFQEAGLYSGAQRYGAQLGLQGQQYMADRGLQEAGIYGGAQRYAADQGYGEAGLYSNAQRYGSDSQLQGQRYLADQGLAEATQYAQAQRYNTEAQERMNAAMMANNLQLGNLNAYGRSVAPNVNWARSWS